MLSMGGGGRVCNGMLGFRKFGFSVLAKKSNVWFNQGNLTWYMFFS